MEAANSQTNPTSDGTEDDVASSPASRAEASVVWSSRALTRGEVPPARREIDRNHHHLAGWSSGAAGHMGVAMVFVLVVEANSPAVKRVKHDLVTTDNAAVEHVDAVGMTQTAERQRESRSAGRAQWHRIGSHIAGMAAAAATVVLMVSCSADTYPGGADLSVTNSVDGASSSSAPISSSNPQAGSVATSLPEGNDESGAAAAVPPISPAQLTPETRPVSGRCTDRIDYAGDPRSNAEINSAGEATGTCPDPISASPTTP